MMINTMGMRWFYREDRHTADVAGLLADLIDAAADHLVDLDGWMTLTGWVVRWDWWSMGYLPAVDPCSLHQGVQYRGAKVRCLFGRKKWRFYRLMGACGIGVVSVHLPLAKCAILLASGCSNAVNNVGSVRHFPRDTKTHMHTNTFG